MDTNTDVMLDERFARKYVKCIDVNVKKFAMDFSGRFVRKSACCWPQGKSV
jgi:hypothetical protein